MKPSKLVVVALSAAAVAACATAIMRKRHKLPTASNSSTLQPATQPQSMVGLPTEDTKHKEAAREEAEAKEVADRKAKEEASRKAKEDADRKAKEDADRSRFRASSTSLRIAAEAPLGCCSSHSQCRGSNDTSRATTPSFGRPGPTRAGATR